MWSWWACEKEKGPPVSEHSESGDVKEDKHPREDNISTQV